MAPYARITQGKVGRLSQVQNENEFEGLCVSPVSGHAVIILKGKRNGNHSISLIHYSKFTPTHTLNKERLSFDNKEELSVSVYFNHLKSNPHLIEVLHVRLQESNIEHELCEFPEKEKGLLVNFDSIKTFNPNESKYDVATHDQHDNIVKYYLLNEEFRLMEGFMEAARLDGDGKIQHSPGDSKIVKYEGDMYRHLSELASYLAEPIEKEVIIFDNQWKELAHHDVELSSFAKDIIAEIPKRQYDSSNELAEQLRKIFTKRSPYLVSSMQASNVTFDKKLLETAGFIMSANVLN